MSSAPRFEVRPLTPDQSAYGCDATTRRGQQCSRFPATWVCGCGVTLCAQHLNAHVPGHARIVRGGHNMQATALDVAAEKVADRLIDEAGFWHAMAEVSFADMLEAAAAEVRRRLAEGHVYNGNGVCVSCERRHWDVPQP